MGELKAEFSDGRIDGVRPEVAADKAIRSVDPARIEPECPRILHVHQIPDSTGILWNGADDEFRRGRADEKPVTDRKVTLFRDAEVRNIEDRSIDIPGRALLPSDRNVFQTKPRFDLFQTWCQIRPGRMKAAVFHPSSRPFECRNASCTNIPVLNPPAQITTATIFHLVNQERRERECAYRITAERVQA